MPPFLCGPGRCRRLRERPSRSDSVAFVRPDAVRCMAWRFGCDAAAGPDSRDPGRRDAPAGRPGSGRTVRTAAERIAAAGQGLDHQPHLTGLPDVEALPLDEPFQLFARVGGGRAADAPYLRVVFPSVHRVDVARFDGPQPADAPFEVHQMPMILLRMSIATPHALAFSLIFETRNFVSL